MEQYILLVYANIKIKAKGLTERSFTIILLFGPMIILSSYLILIYVKDVWDFKFARHVAFDDYYST